MNFTFDNSEALRIQALRDHDILDSAFEEQFDEITRLASTICQMPISAISLIDTDRQWFKAVIGLPENVRETPREVAFCAHAIQSDELMEVEDATSDARFQNNSLVTGAPDIRHYAGQPLIDSAGLRLGTLCVIDDKPGKLNDFQRQTLRYLARLTMHLMEDRKRELESLKQRILETSEREKAAELLGNITRGYVDLVPGFNFRVIPADRFSGDMIGATVGHNGNSTVIIADVMGHGLPSALLLSPIHSSFRQAVMNGLELEDIARTVNQALHGILPPGTFVAAALLSINKRLERMRVWNGGMPDALLVDKAGDIVHRFSSRHVALGIHGDDAFDSSCEETGFGDSVQLVAFSDGLIECSNESGETFGIVRLEKSISAFAHKQRFDGILHAIADFTGDISQRDDMSLLTLDLAQT